jgi:ankyrin repeat protein
MRENLISVNTLISRGAAINNPPNSASTSMTPLAAAIKTQNYELVDFLIQKGANPYDSLAVKEATNDIGLLHILLTALQSWDKPPDNKNVRDKALDKAMEEHNLETVGALLCCPLMGINPIDRLSWALQRALTHDSNPNLEIICMVLSRGADPNMFWEFGDNSDGIYLRSALCVAIGRNVPGGVKVLLEAGGKADSNLTRGMYDSPMQFATSCRRQDIVRILLEDGSNPNAVALPKGNKRKTNDQPERDNGTPVQIAVSNRDTGMIKLLLKYNGNSNTIFGNMNHTPLQMASRDGNKEIVELLLKHGAEVNAPPAKEFGVTALQFAAIKGLLGIAHLLLEYEADVNAPSAEVNGRTALEGAAEHGRIDMVQLLLNAGANIFQDGEAEYKNAIRASENGHYAVQQLLESYHGWNLMSSDYESQNFLWN